MGVSPFGVCRRDRGADIRWARLSAHAEPPQADKEGGLNPFGSVHRVFDFVRKPGEVVVQVAVRFTFQFVRTKIADQGSF